VLEKFAIFGKVQLQLQPHWRRRFMPLSSVKADSALLRSCCDIDLVQTLEGGDLYLSASVVVEYAAR